MARGERAQLAADLFNKLCSQRGWGADEAWKGIAMLLLTCEVWERGWKEFFKVIVYRERNDFHLTKAGKPNAALRKARALSNYLASSLGCDPAALCQTVGQYWRHAEVSGLQPNNLVGHAFRSIVVEALKAFGTSGISYEEEVNPHDLFAGYQFSTRSKDPKIDIVARKEERVVAMISTRWRFRHDRVDVVEEALAYQTPAQRAYGGPPFYAVTGEFSASRLEKILKNCPPEMRRGPVDAAVHFEPELLAKGLGENGRLTHLKSLAWLIAQTKTW